ncbi:shikimate dehydrogenase [Fimbriiglobus ruber]|uniref:Shikimate dehydrogenase (NADP(+)) n=1 Tax=Fimbriiglobus ruber TaxID=1908690 RepID=A0A225E3Z8_9BACT|nr:shikimate dehydrogenase [Fimbriiglobus ruber]OWK43405.1 3-dehydroquinate dehydratase I [Fimbriiglobus ruber]
MSVAPDRVCVVVGRTRHKMVQAEIQEAFKRGAAFIELRLDFLARAVDFKRLAPLKQCAWLASIRRPQDGGRWPGKEDDRQMILRQAIISGAFEWIDLETDVANTIRRYGTVKRIISYHNMTETPADLDQIYERMLAQDADVIKIAVMAQHPRDNERVLELQRRATKPTIAFCMGEIGFPTRFLSLKYGAPWIYAAFNKERGVAPGLPAVEDFKTTYPVRSINADTKVFGLLGDPVSHSFGPVLHNHTLGRLKQNAIYLPFRVPKGQLEEAVKAFERVPVSGYSVTIPHKEAAAALAKEAEPNVQLCGAANTLIRRDDGTFFAANTDFTASFESIVEHLKARAEGGIVDFNSVFVLVLGAGGAARAVAHGLHKAGAHVTIAARTQERAAKLAAEIECKVVDWHARHNVLPCEVLVNCTPVGMHPNTDESPIHVSFLRPGLTVFDTVYTPENTKLINEARSRGCDLITGVDMFVRQAAEQVKLFTGQTPNVDKMREILRKAMSPLTRALDDETDDADAAADE